jgi:predicted metalloprotease with PDZ domain
VRSVISLALILTSLQVWAAEEVRHTVSFPADRQQLILVQSEFPVSGPHTDLIMPSWTPGSYLIREFAANVDRLSAASVDGKPLSVEKISKDQWRVETGQAEAIVVSYEISTPDLNVSSSWASQEFTLINGASVFLYTSQSKELPQLLSVVTDEQRGKVHTAMSQGVENNTWRSINYDELVDSPVAVANAPVYSFEHLDHQYNLLNVGENQFWDGRQAAADVEKIVAETQLFWKTNPLKKPYWFLNFAYEGKGGLEHDHSTVMMSGRRLMTDRDDYIKWLGLVTHEFFHVWNVRNMRPAELADIDYQHEQYTTQLWLAEGLTSYYDNLIMSRAGLIKPEEYMALLASDIYRLEITPGRFLSPVTEASVNAWIRHYQPKSNSLNNTISYYTKGAVIGFVVDAFIRKETKGRHNLDEVMRAMYTLYGDKPYDKDAFAAIVVDIAGSEAGDMLQTFLTTTTEPDVDAALDWYGLKLNRGPKNKDKTASEDDEERMLPSGIGVIWEEGTSEMIVKTVLSGSAGAFAGLIPADEILAIGNERLTSGTKKSLMSSFSPGDETTLLVSRRGRVMTLDVTLETAIPERYDIVLQSGFGKRHIKRIQSLLGQSLKSQP